MSKTLRGVALAVASVFCIGVGTASAATTQVVTEGSVTRQAENTPPTNNWVLYTRNAGTGAFVDGPATPPLGSGSFQTVTPTGADKVYLFNYDHIGTKLTDVDAIGYSTYRTSGASPNQVPAINLEGDYNAPAAAGFPTLVFEPVYNTAQGT